MPLAGIRPSDQCEVTLSIEYPHEPGWIAKIATIIADRGSAIRVIDLVDI